MSSWWCYISFQDLFKYVYGRKPTDEERAEYKKLSREQLNQWVINHMAQAHGIYVGVMMNGYLAFTILPYFMKGIWDKELRFDDGTTKQEFTTSSGHKFRFEVTKRNGTYHLQAYWDNGGDDCGTGEITMSSDGYLSNFCSTMPKRPFSNVAFNFDTMHFQGASNGAESTRRFVTAGLED
jgi:hypothetical protein